MEQNQISKKKTLFHLRLNCNVYSKGMLHPCFVPIKGLLFLPDDAHFLI